MAEKKPHQEKTPFILTRVENGELSDDQIKRIFAELGISPAEGDGDSGGEGSED